MNCKKCGKEMTVADYLIHPIYHDLIHPVCHECIEREVRKVAGEVMNCPKVSGLSSEECPINKSCDDCPYDSEEVNAQLGRCADD